MIFYPALLSIFFLSTSTDGFQAQPLLQLATFDIAQTELKMGYLDDLKPYNDNPLKRQTFAKKWKPNKEKHSSFQSSTTGRLQPETIQSAVTQQINDPVSQTRAAPATVVSPPDEISTNIKSVERDLSSQYLEYQQFLAQGGSLLNLGSSLDAPVIDAVILSPTEEGSIPVEEATIDSVTPDDDLVRIDVITTTPANWASMTSSTSKPFVAANSTSYLENLSHAPPAATSKRVSSYKQWTTSRSSKPGTAFGAFSDQISYGTKTLEFSPSVTESAAAPLTLSTRRVDDKPKPRMAHETRGKVSVSGKPSIVSVTIPNQATLVPVGHFYDAAGDQTAGGLLYPAGAEELEKATMLCSTELGRTFKDSSSIVLFGAEDNIPKELIQPMGAEELQKATMMCSRKLSERLKGKAFILEFNE